MAQLFSSSKNVAGKHAAGYIRVSTARQRSRTGVDQGDGFSEDDQIERIVSFFVRKQLAFQLYSDCGLSGRLPTRDPKLMEKLWRRKARTYKAVFEAVFLNDRKYTAEEIGQMRGYMGAEVKRIERGGALAGVDDDDEASMLPLRYPHPSPALAQQPHGAGAGDNSNGNASEAIVSDDALLPQHKNRTRGASAAKFRPALTFFVDDLSKVHTLALTDMSRFARSDALFAELTDQLERHEVHIEGVIESLSWINDQELSGALTAWSVRRYFRLMEALQPARKCYLLAAMYKSCHRPPQPLFLTS